MNVKLHNVLVALFLHLARLFRLCLRLIELLLVDGEAKLIRHEAREIYWEAVCVIQTPHVFPRELGSALLSRVVHITFEKLLSAVKCTRK